MNFKLRGGVSVILMSRRRGAPYADKILDDGRTLIYEGHDASRTRACPEPKKLDQPEFSETGSPTQNGLFRRAVVDYKAHGAPAACVRVYDKIKTGIWAYAGLFDLVDAWVETDTGRRVFKFKLEIHTPTANEPQNERREILHNRIIPTNVKLAVWKRDKGQCVLCGSRENLHFDHILPFSKGGTSLVAENLQLLCAKHNLQKRDRIE